MTAVRKVIQFPKRADAIRRAESELAFLPAALEIVETPPSPIGRAIGATVISVFCVALIWASVGTVDIVATAPGKIVPSGRTKVIQPFETGVVRAIHVRDGQKVRAGEVLIELDPTMTDAERDHLKSDLLSSQMEVARLRAAVSGESDPAEAFVPPESASPSMIEMNRQLLISQVAEHQGKLAALDRQIKQKEAERESTKAAIAKLEATIPILSQKVEIRKYLYDKNLGSKIVWLTDYQELTGLQQEVLVQKSHLQEAEAAMAALVETRAQTAAEYRRARFEELAKAQEKAAGQAQDVIKAEKRAKLQVLQAPVDGVVQQLSVHTIGGVVTPAEPLLVVVPLDSRLEIEAMVSNRDIGFVHEGQSAEIKVDTFNFTRYGLLHGEVINVSQDAITRDKSQEKSGDKVRGAEVSSSEPKGQELNYAARVSLDRMQMQVEDRLVNLSPGMAVTIEIKTGSRRIISYLLSPIIKYKQEMFRER
ncbi:hemolysin secretion protein D [Bradyrhizobium macuxiense]|uniref:Membrane fusion protein (MFP) family protein n=1 Tax=Bradyrhizobium macuxiense TaxID=1755647 RepID=A0A109K2N2_9BRAD|nr:HlyD family type I secretion periplasmic adaptor subunit [Bradyrhizobium macuxiense]KWV59694.1 hemolysin secretion protein D [Bradyrhizobium macuxiense]